MDEVGWHARRRSAKEDLKYRYPVRNVDGTFNPVEQEPAPIGEEYGGAAYTIQRDRAHPRGPPPVPPKDSLRPPPPGAMRNVPGALGLNGHALSRIESSSVNGHSKFTTESSFPATALERSRLHPPPQRMEPHLQLMAGPLLRYDTIDAAGVWHGACLVVTADAGSSYEPGPNLTLAWDPDQRRPGHGGHVASETTSLAAGGLAPHPADLFSSNLSPTTSHMHIQDTSTPGPRTRQATVEGQEIWVYQGRVATFTFWRFMIQIPLADTEMAVRYRLNSGIELDFHVPGRGQNMRCAAYSCNGFSAAINPDDFRGPGFRSGSDPVWMDLLEHHTQVPFHALIGGGDQLYCDTIIREPELQEWVLLKTPQEKREFQLKPEAQHAIDRFFFSHYCSHFRTGAFARANSTIPMINMLDDHDLIDGFGSYPDDLQSSPVFRTIGSRGYFFYLLFQCFVVPDIDGVDPAPGAHLFKSTIIGGDGPYIPYPSHSLLTSLGPKVWMLMLDCRAERRREQVCSNIEYDRVFDRVMALPSGIDHLVVQLGIPIAYPRMNFIETALSSKLNPLVAISRTGTLAKNFVNKFNADAELLDDLNDHWTAKGHKAERNWFVEQMQSIAIQKRMRVTFLSGDVHCAAVGLFKTLPKKGRNPTPSKDHRYMLNVVSSAIVNTPPPNGVLTMVTILGKNKHRTMHHADTDECMIPLFKKEPDGSAAHSHVVMGRRNYCIVEHEPGSGELAFEIRVEIEKGRGKTVGYEVRAPPPLYEA